MATNAPRSLQIYDPVLTTFARHYKPRGFIADQLLVDTSVSVLSNQYPVFKEEYWFRNDVDNEIADRSPAKEIDFEWSLDTFYCKEYALKVGITDLERLQAHAALKLEQNKTNLLTGRMQLAHEVRVAGKLLPVSLGGGLSNSMTAAAAVKWDVDTADAEEDIQAGVMAMYQRTGRRPNVIVIPFPTAYALAMNDVFRNLLKYDVTGRPIDFIQMGLGILPSVIHGMKVVIPEGAQIDTGREGAAAQAVKTEIWGEHVRLLHIDSSATWGEVSVAYRINHTAKRVTRWRETDPDIEYIREMERYDVKVVAPELGYVITDTLT